MGVGAAGCAVVRGIILHEPTLAHVPMMLLAFGGGDPDAGRIAAKREAACFAERLGGAKLVVFVGCLSEAATQGALPVIARVARDGLAAVVVAATLAREGADPRARAHAELAIRCVRENADVFVHVGVPETTRAATGGAHASTPSEWADARDTALRRTATSMLGVVDYGFLCVDFDEVLSVYRRAGGALGRAGHGTARGAGRADAATLQALAAVAPGGRVRGEAGILVHMAGGTGTRMREVQRVIEIVAARAPDADCIVSAVIDERLDGDLRVDVVHTGAEFRVTAQQVPLADAWQGAFARLVSEVRAEAPRCSASGCRSVDLACLCVSAARILALLPGEFDLRAESCEEMRDGSGECVDFESESAVYASDAERAIFAFTDHWQAGLGGSVTVYPSEEAYRNALRAAVEACEADGAEDG